MQESIGWVKSLPPPPKQSMQRLDKLDISKAFINKLCGNEELGWNNDSYILKMINEQPPPWSTSLQPARDKYSQYTHFTLVIGKDNGADIEMFWMQGYYILRHTRAELYPVSICLLHLMKVPSACKNIIL